MKNQAIYDVIIIGAGAAGIGAAAGLSNNDKISYVILEARDRIGGRIISKDLSGITVQLGATWIHTFNENNPMYKYVKQLNIKQADLYRNKKHIIVNAETGKQVDQKVQDQANSKFQQFFSYLKQVSSKQQSDISVYEVLTRFCQQNLNYVDPQVKTCTLQKLSQIQSYQATNSRQLSAKSLDISIQTGVDFLPKGGYKQLFEKIAYPYINKVQFSKIVKLICYQKQKAMVQCHDGSVYFCKKIVSSLPLGVLKSKKVEFQPQLPKEYQLSIEKLGCGLENKILVQFETNFWGSSEWIFIMSNKGQKFTHIFNYAQKGKNILCCFIAGDQAHKYQQQNSKKEVMLKDLLQILETTYGSENVKPKQYIITDWGRDEFTLGSYSYFHVDSSPQDCKRLRTPILQTLWIVGQHCWGECLGTVNGAFKTGQLAAQQIIQCLEKDKKITKILSVQ